MLKTGGPAVLARETERVNIVFANISPVLERDAQLEGSLDGCDKILLLDLQEFVQGHDGWDGRLTDPNRADLFRLDQLDVEVRAQQPGQRCRRHPAGRATAGDNDFLYLVVFHDSFSLI